MPIPEKQIHRYNLKLHQDAMKEIPWMLRHAIGKDHPYTMNCAGCAMIEEFLKENPE